MTRWRVERAAGQYGGAPPGNRRGTTTVSARDTRALWVIIRRPANDNPMPMRIRLLLVGRWMTIVTSLVLVVGYSFRLLGQ